MTSTSRYQPYPSYKDSRVEWLGDVPSTWNIHSGKRVFRNRREVASIDDEQLAASQKYGVIPQKLMMKLNGSKVMLALKGTESFRHVEKNDFVISLRSFEGGIEHSSYVGCVSPAYTVLSAQKLLSSSYFRYLFKSKPFIQALQSTTDSLRDGKSITYEQFSKIPLALPTNNEQTVIANFLDQETGKMDLLIEKQQAMIALLKEKRQASISHAVTKGLDDDSNENWKEFRLDWVCNIVRGNTGFKKDELLHTGKFIALQYGKTYKVDEVNQEFNFYVNDEFYKQSQIVSYGDTVLISTSETMEDLGHSCFYARKDLGLLGGEQILLSPDAELISPKFLYFSSKEFCRGLRKYATGLKVFRFNTDDLKTIKILLPSLKKQDEIVDYLQSQTQNIDTLIEKSQQGINLLKERKTALISAAVTGKIDVRGIVNG